MTEGERIAAHEGGHAVAAVLLGAHVRLIDVAGDATRLGHVEHIGADERDRMKIILAGIIEGAETWAEIPTWPLRTDASTDERNLHDLADFLGLDERGYGDVL